MDRPLEQVYGRGWAFPPQFELAQGVAMVAGAEDVRQSLVVLFSTLPGERIMRERYGCDLNAFMFANISTALISQIEAQIYDAVLTWEPRAEVVELVLGQSEVVPSILQIRLTYRLRGSELSGELSGRIDLLHGTSTMQ